MATLDATSLKILAENRETFKKRAHVKKVLHRLLVEHKIVPTQDLKGNTSVLHAHEDVKVHSVVDMCVKDIVGQTLIRQYYSPPADVKFDQTSQAVDTVTKDLLMDSSPEDLSDVLFGDGDSLAPQSESLCSQCDPKRQNYHQDIQWMGNWLSSNLCSYVQGAGHQLR